MTTGLAGHFHSESTDTQLLVSPSARSAFCAEGGRLTSVYLAFFDACEQAGLTKEELSFRAGLSRPYISQLERNLKSPTVDTLFLICGALGVSASDVIGRVEAARRGQSRR